ncbi:uncharacterized protein [Haliotis cracherodii]|uniref:uncharacterized protein n=1 Tax=Haliotis cracherodii TaxID=6455 RepID=UPI0039E9707D
MAGARPQPTQKLFKINQMKVVTYVGDITTISDASGVVTGEGLEFEHESFVTRALKENSSEFAVKREELKGKARRFKSWSVHTTKLSEPSPFSYVFHAVIKSPVNTNRWVTKTEHLYKTIMKKAEKYDVKVLAIPLLGTGRGGASPEDAAQAAVKALAKFDNQALQKVFLVTIDKSIGDILETQCEYQGSPNCREKNLKRRNSLRKLISCAVSRTEDEDRASYGKAPMDNRPRSYRNRDKNHSRPVEKYTQIGDERRDETNFHRNQYTGSIERNENHNRYRPESEYDGSYRKVSTDHRSGSHHNRDQNRRYPDEGYGPITYGYEDERAETDIHTGPVNTSEKRHRDRRSETFPGSRTANDQDWPGSSKAAVRDTAFMPDRENRCDTRETGHRHVDGQGDDYGRPVKTMQTNPGDTTHRNNAHHEGVDGHGQDRGGYSGYNKENNETMFSLPDRHHNGDTRGESGNRSLNVADVHSSHIPSQTFPRHSRSSRAMLQGNTYTAPHRDTTHDSHHLSYKGYNTDKHGDDGRRQQQRQQTKTTKATLVVGQTCSDESASGFDHIGSVHHGTSPSPYPLTVNLDAVDGEPRNVRHTSSTDRVRGMDHSTRPEVGIKTEINGVPCGDSTVPPGNSSGKVARKGSSNDVKLLDMSVTRSCPICIGPITDPKWLKKCGHVFCRECIDDSFQKFKPVCPSCNMVYGVLTGNQPEGSMDVAFSGEHLPGYETCGTISITYHLPSGIQREDHPNPGQPYKGTTRRAFLPDCREGRDVLRLLRKAFDRKLTFTIGRSTTTGQENVVTWNDIHHKTNMEGGPTRFGYPDPGYLERVQDELASKGVTENKETTF